MWTGDLYKDIKVEVPEYYRQTNEFLNRDKTDGRILMLPMIGGDGVRYKWGYQGVEPSEFFFDKPAVSKILRTSYFDEKYQRLSEAFSQNQDFNQLLSEMNIKYLVLHDDLDTKVSGASSSAEVRKVLDKNPDIKFLEKFGELSVFEFLGNKNPSLFVATKEGKEINPLSYNKLSPTRYVVSVKKAKNPYNLVFKSTFNDLWEVRIDGEKIGGHFLVYDYANGWKMEKEGSYNIDVVFKVWPWE